MNAGEAAQRALSAGDRELRPRVSRTAGRPVGVPSAGGGPPSGADARASAASGDPGGVRDGLGNAGAHRVLVFGTARIGAAYGRRALDTAHGRRWLRPTGLGDCVTLRLMKVLVVGAGGVGAAFAAIAQRRTAFERVVLADVAPERVRGVVAGLGEPGRFAAERVDASAGGDLVELIGSVQPDAVLNACDPRFNEPIFEAAFEAKVTYLDMAMTLSTPTPSGHTSCPARCSARTSSSRHEDWEQAGLLALVGIGVEPGLSDVFAAYAAQELFSSVAEVGVRDGATSSSRATTSRPRSRSGRRSRSA